MSRRRRSPRSKQRPRRARRRCRSRSTSEFSRRSASCIRTPPPCSSWRTTCVTRFCIASCARRVAHMADTRRRGWAGGRFSFGPNRAPKSPGTMTGLASGAEWVTPHQNAPETLREATLGACGDVDPLESPDIKGRREATNRATGFTREARERFKQRLLKVSADDLRRVTHSYFMAAPAVQTTVAGADLIEEARRERPELFQVVAPL